MFQNISTESKTNGENNSSDSKLTESKIKIHEHQPQEMKPNKDIRVLVRSHAVDKTDITLPSVKELAKQFTKVESKPPQPKARWKPPQKTSQDNGDYSPKHSESSNSSDHADNSYSSDTRDAREEEVDYSIVPVSEIISNLLKNKNEENSRKIKEKISASHIKENGVSKPDLTASEPVIHMVRFNGKQVHSLTARSISKEFREGLKKNSTYHRLVKIDRGSSGESDHGEIYSATDPNRPPTPPIDLKSKKKFWEDIISNSSK